MTTQPSFKSVENGKMADVSMTEAIAEFKEAASHVYDAVSMMGNASAASAKAQLNEGKIKAMELEEKAEELVRAKPLVTIGVAFAAGWLISRLMQRK